MKKILLIAFLQFFNVSFSQKAEYSVLHIPDSLKLNANAVIRLNQEDIVIESQRSLNVRTKRVVTVLNSNGLEAINASESYDKSSTVKNIAAVIYDKNGNEIKKIKRKDFTDISAIGGGTMFSDNRLIYLDYTPVSYPFTIEYTSETQNSNTAFIPQWYPLTDYNVGIEKSVLNVNYLFNLGFKKKECNFSGFRIKKLQETDTQLSYLVQNIPPQKHEELSVAFSDHYPVLMMGLNNFHLMGVDGSAKSWEDFGKWYHSKVLSGTDNLPEETKNKIRSLVGDEKDPLKKAQIVYDFVQQKVRYVSVQLGIGGWKPMLAADVDRLGYGDCKALTNYTKSLLETVGVPSYHTVLYGSRAKRNICADFVSMQGNHMILAIPNGSNYVWLECTSQDDPFGYQANFTDDRDVLVVKPEGGEIVRSRNYQNEENSQVTTGKYAVSQNGSLSAEILIATSGSQYGLHRELEGMSADERSDYYKSGRFRYLGNLKIKSAEFLNDRQKVAFSEKLALEAENYGKITGSDMIIMVNAFDQYNGLMKKVRERKTSFEIQRGFVDKCEIAIDLPEGYTLEFLPEKLQLNSKFGTYTAEVVRDTNKKLFYKRTFSMKKGVYKSDEYEQFRLFSEQVSRNDNGKLILTPKTKNNEIK